MLSIAPFRKVLLTATPLQNSLLELYGLVSIIDDFAFGDTMNERKIRHREGAKSAKDVLSPFRTLRLRGDLPSVDSAG